MSAVWRAHFTYNKYTQIASRAVRTGLKESERVKAEKRADVGIKYQIWANGQGGEQKFIAPELVAAEVAHKPAADAS